MSRLRGLLVQKVIENRELLCRLGEPYLLALAVVRDKPLAERRQGPYGDRDTADVAPGAALPGQRPPQDEAIIVFHLFGEVAEGFGEEPGSRRFGEDERAFDGCLAGARADRLGAGAAAEEHLQGGGKERLARPRLAGDHVEAGGEFEGGLFDQGHVLHGELREHYRNVLRTARHQLQSSVRPILTLSPESLISTLPPAGISRGSAPSSESSASRSTSASSATWSSPRTRGLLTSACGAMGTST